jgi:hypothetical protein
MDGKTVKEIHLPYRPHEGLQRGTGDAKPTNSKPPSKDNKKDSGSKDK